MGELLRNGDCCGIPPVGHVSHVDTLLCGMRKVRMWILKRWGKLAKVDARLHPQTGGTVNYVFHASS